MKRIVLLSLLSFSLVAQNQKKTKTIRSSLSENTTKSAEAMAAPVSTLYSFSTFTAPYQPIMGTSLSGGLKWDDNNYTVPMGFNFKLYGTQGSTVNFAEGNFATLTNPVSMILTLASPMFEDLCDRAFNPNTDKEGDPGGISTISYTVTGLAGSRICKIEVENAGFFEENLANDTSVSSVNFQVWFYETSNDIEFRFGAVDIQNAAINLQNPGGFICGLGENVDLNTANCLSSNLLNGPYNNPSVVALTSNVNEIITGDIDSGRVYKFTRAHPNLVGLNENTNEYGICFFPNPASKTLYFKSDSPSMTEASISFYGMDGRLILEKKLASEIDLSEISKGVYLLKVESNSGEYLYTSKLVIVD